MARQLDNIIVVDLEATCWKDQPPAGQESEIIEIGVAVLNVHSRQITAKESILIRPERSEVSRFCMVLTSLTPEILAEKGISFVEACRKLEAIYQTKERTWASFGDYDRRMFERQCQERDVRYPFGVSHLNVKNLFALVAGLPREVGMDEALKMSGIELEGKHHRGMDDAYNTAKLLGRLLSQMNVVADKGAS